MFYVFYNPFTFSRYIFSRNRKKIEGPNVKLFIDFEIFIYIFRFH